MQEWLVDYFLLVDKVSPDCRQLTGHLELPLRLRKTKCDPGVAPTRVAFNIGYPIDETNIAEDGTLFSKEALYAFHARSTVWPISG
jgi:hypothetical protein